MKFGLLKSQVENKLLEGYKTNNLKKELKTFNELVLENKKLSSLFFIYDELSTKKGMSNKDKANEYINECIKIYENNINKVTQKELSKIRTWVNGVDCKNNYDVIDNLLSSDILKIESKIDSRKTIVETLLRNEDFNKEEINLPLKSLVNVANSTINKYIEKLDEDTKKELKSLLSKDESTLETDYITIKEEVLTKLNSLKDNSDLETQNRIDESITKIKNERFDKLNLFRLKSLNESI
jgi:hypothetical protein